MGTRDAEAERLAEDARRDANWKRWGTYLPERQWGTVREDYSPNGDSWQDFTHDASRSRTYRWGEDGLLGFTDRECRLCFAPALWNGRDPILKERMFGLSNPEGNHGEDVKELYFYLDATPTHSYAKALYKYPHAEFPYAQLIEENRARGKDVPELDLLDTGVFDGDRYFDLFVEYAKAAPDDVLIRLTAVNRGPAATLHLLPTFWFRNTWAWGRTGEGYWEKPRLALEGESVKAEHASLGTFRLYAEGEAEWLFTDNESNFERLFKGARNTSAHVKDAFHRKLVDGEEGAVNPAREGTKAGAHRRFEIPQGGSVVFKLRMCPDEGHPRKPFGSEFDRVFSDRIAEANAFHEARMDPALSPEERNVTRQALAGLLWTKQFYQYVVKDWLEGDPAFPKPSAERREGRNAEWRTLYSRDVLSMPDKWEYPWFAAWDLAFHMVPFSRVDPKFAQDQLLLLLREWYMHPSGQLPAYEYNFSDVNPPVHAWAVWRVYGRTGPRGQRDLGFLKRAFPKLLINFTWWVNRKDPRGDNLFGGGFLGLDNIGVFDRSKPLPGGASLEQADGTAWMAFYCSTLLTMALELAQFEPAYEDIASKFFEHFVAIADAMNTLGGTGLWDEEDGFYYDQLMLGGESQPLRVRSMVGLIPIFASAILEDAMIEGLPGFTKRLNWFLNNRPELAKGISYASAHGARREGERLLAIPSRERLERVLRYAFDEDEFLSDYGLRSVSKFHAREPFVFDGAEVGYVPGDSDSGMFGGNSNWRGPIWMPLNYLFIEALERYAHFYGEGFQVEFPTGSGRRMHLGQIAVELSRRLSRLFLPDAEGYRACFGGDPRFVKDPAFKNLVLFHEYFHGDTGRGLGASHQTGWTALAAELVGDARGDPDRFLQREVDLSKRRR